MPQNYCIYVVQHIILAKRHFYLVIFKLNVTIVLQNTDSQNKMCLYRYLADKQALSTESLCNSANN